MQVANGDMCPICAGKFSADGKRISLGDAHPDIAAELVNPDDAKLAPKSHKKVMWRCNKGHEYKAEVASRTNAGSGCPYCSGRKAVVGENDLATTHPEIAAQLVDQSLATQLSAGSGKKVEWRCEHGHIYTSTPNRRTGCDAKKAAGCPVCAKNA